jgi:hypothetical protein
MATTTPNFGWAVPTSTDLVKDGAIAIETLGDAIDASLLDLKGGTTGQVLKKNTDTDMDFIWSSDAAGMTNPMTTTGDTIYSSSGSTPARLGIGSSGNVLTVTGGVPVWAAPASGSYTQLATGTLSGASIALNSIPGTYRDLVLVLTAYRPNADGDQIYFYYNNDTSSIYQNVGVSGAGETSVGGAPSGTMRIGYDVDSAVYANNFSYLRTYEYASAVNFKTAHYHFMHTPSSGTATNQAYGWQMALARLSSAITRIDIAIRTAGGSASSFLGGTYTLYGVK